MQKTSDHAPLLFDPIIFFVLFISISVISYLCFLGWDWILSCCTSSFNLLWQWIACHSLIIQHYIANKSWYLFDHIDRCSQNRKYILHLLKKSSDLLLRLNCAFAFLHYSDIGDIGVPRLDIPKKAPMSVVIFFSKIYEFQLFSVFAIILVATFVRCSNWGSGLW